MSLASSATKLTQPKKWVMGNWKLNPHTTTDAVNLSGAVSSGISERGYGDVNVVIAPTFIHLTAVQQSVVECDVMAQDVSSHQGTGAFTGEVSAEVLANLGLQSVLVGHSERRQNQCETNETLIKKITNSLDKALIPVFCIGESLDIRENGQHLAFIKSQIVDVLSSIQDRLTAENIILAYEPVWAIGTGKVADTAQITEMHQHIRTVLIELNPDLDVVSLLYGGSVKPDNAQEIANCDNVNGALVGGASLNPEHFLDIVNAFR